MKSLRWIFLWSAAIAMASIGVSIFSAAAEVDWSRIREMGISEILENGIGPILVMLVVLVIVLGTLFSIYRMMFPPKMNYRAASPSFYICYQ